MDLDVINQLDQSVSNWSDYNRIYYHPRSINPIVTHEIDNDITPFDNFNIGRQAYRDNEKELELFDENFRFFVEECDNLQGFQMMVDVDDGFGGFSESLLHDIRDEFAKAPIFLYGLSDSRAVYRNERQKQKIMLNRALSLTRLSQLASVYIPIYTPTNAMADKCGLSSYLQFNDNSKYHTSAIVAAAIDNNSIPYRLTRPQLSMGDVMTKIVQANNSRLASLSVSIPLPILAKGYRETMETFKFDDQLKPLLPLLQSYSKQSTDVYSEIVVTRGLPVNYPKDRTMYIERLLSTFKDTNDLLHTNVDIEAALPLPESFPHIFKACFDSNGYISHGQSNHDSLQSIPILTHFESGSRLKHYVDRHIENVDTIDFKDFHEYAEGEIPITREDFLQMKEELITLSDTYNTDEDF
ncbi:tubulin domain-containing protein [Mycotypha africana]|uniref:tubulin domain-containing protein n=1 Tax=Mycotypha africana TaxID=64632 RepID=UPI00230185FA|nr:tubulin domain-containing protein [Mycotypha africana]KAI8988227.1 tubulin domain-containing protein [Mycotypha africana]